MIVDTSALVAIVKGEPDGEELLRLIADAGEAKVSAGTLIETRIVCVGRGLEPALDKLLRELAPVIVPVDARQVEFAAEGARRFGKGRHAAGLNFGDLFAYALARALREPLLFVGGDFARTDVKPARV